jgi:hypothetical protein
MERSRLDGVARLQLNFKMIWKSHGLGTAPGIEVSVATNTPFERQSEPHLRSRNLPDIDTI